MLEWMNGLRTKLLGSEFNTLCAILLIFPLGTCFFPCFRMLAFAGPPFLSRNLIIKWFTIEKNVEYYRSIVGPSDENVMNLQKCPLIAVPWYSKSVVSSEQPAWLLTEFLMGLIVFFTLLNQTQVAWLLYKQKALWGAARVPSLGSGLGHSHKPGVRGTVPKAFGTSISEQLGYMLKTYYHGRALWFGPMNNSYFCFRFPT